LKKGIITVTFLIAILCIWAVVYVTHITPETRAKYQELLLMSLTPNNPSDVYESHQKRLQVSKNIYLDDNGSRLHVRILSDASYVDFETDGHESQVVEHLVGIKSLMQEEIFSTSDNKQMQVLRQMEADKGTYYYKENKFTADQVDIARYVVNGDILPLSIQNVKPLMTGHAKSAVLALDDQFQFTAKEMRATIHSVDKEND
jgi:hypothetical protein